MNIITKPSSLEFEPIPAPLAADERIVVIGLGYVGLPVVVAFADVYEDVRGFDISERRVGALLNGHDSTGEISDERLSHCRARFSHDRSILAGASFYIIAVPTPVDVVSIPDLRPLESACEIVAPYLSSGAVVVFESTVYPGVTEQVCGPLLERLSGRTRGVDFFLGYSPERINPGDKERNFTTILKIVSGENAETLERIARVYEWVVAPGVFRARSIMAAEAAKMVENTQRDVNIAFMNEVAMFCHALDMPTADVLEAAGTKWNFLPFRPGLVGGHCIGVDPCYMVERGRQMGFRTHLVEVARKINEGMVDQVVNLLSRAMFARGRPPGRSRIGFLGVTFKENVPDIRNSKALDIINRLSSTGAECVIHDPAADPGEVLVRHGLRLVTDVELGDLDAIVVAVAHDCYKAWSARYLSGLLRGKEGVIFDVKGLWRDAAFAAGVQVISL